MCSSDRKIYYVFYAYNKGHLIRDCGARIKYFKGEERHHMCICYGKKSAKDWQSESTSVKFSGNSTIDYSVLLQTARAQVSSVDGKICNNLRLLFDSGAQMSYVTSRVTCVLKLIQGTRNVIILT